ncbi:MAG: Hsp20/alpha crystallin family protein [Nitrospirota bacterium]
MTLVRWDPIKNLVTLQERMNRLFDESMQRGESVSMDRGTWVPPVDIYETENDIMLVAEVPGMDEKDIDIELRDNVLTVKGERGMERTVKEDSYHRVERTYGSFSRSFTLPQTIDSERITATTKKGVLEIKMPKAVKARAQQIKIESDGAGGEKAESGPK